MRLFEALDSLGRSLDVRFRGWRPMLLFAGSLLFMTLTVAILPRPRELPPTPSVALFESEPDIRVLLRTLRPHETEKINGSPLTFDRNEARLGERTMSLPSLVRPGSNDSGIRVGEHTYPGVLELSLSGEDLELINVVPLETYLEGVIEAEMGLHFPDEALMAQAICARSYAAVRMIARQERNWHVGNTQATQVFRGVTRNPSRSRSIVARSRAAILTYNQKPFEGLYSSTCGGVSRSAEEAFGSSVPPPLQGGVTCNDCDDVSTYEWSASCSESDLSRSLGTNATGIVRLEQSKSGRLVQAIFATSRGERALTGTRLKSLLGRSALSTWITSLNLSGGRLRAEGRGFGHGVGLCQYGARGMARRGIPCEDILHHYYPQMEIRRAWAESE